MDMVTTDEDVKMEDQILMLYSSLQSLVYLLFKFCHTLHALYTYSSNHSTLLKG